MERYTDAEINKNIETLTKKMERLQLDRTDITKNINSVKKQIQFWQELDKRQLKIF